ncbi:hypothetical protein GF323_00085 [Candidatus Woesearchaeota archaeon]|nr:hypothetical protein [Candidatus Woesearchaeota archaeon]
MEVWGDAIVGGTPVADGLPVTAMVNNVDYAQASSTANGMYDVILVNGDRPLTYNDDPNCAAHWAAGEACVPCTPGYGPAHPGNENDYCIEGPQNGSVVNILINNSPTIPVFIWNEGSVAKQKLIVATGGIINFLIDLVPGWNLISIPVLPVDTSITSIMKGCNYNRIWEFQADQSWKSTDTGLAGMDIGHGYWIDRVGLPGNCQINVSGTLPVSTTVGIDSPWTLVGYPSLTAEQITNLVPGGIYNRIWEFQADQSWKSTDTGLTTMEPGKGYWIHSSAPGSYNVTN